VNDDKKLPVSDTDEMTVAGGPATDQTRRLGDYQRTNAPLSAVEIEHRKRSWPLQNDGVEEIVPLPDKPTG
jgi:hypothetical protein